MVQVMDDLSINGPLPSATPIKEIRSRNSGGGDQPQSRNKRAVHDLDLPEEDDPIPEDEQSHTVDEQV